MCIFLICLVIIMMIIIALTYFTQVSSNMTLLWSGQRGGSVVEFRTPEREVGGSIPTAAVLCP